MKTTDSLRYRFAILAAMIGTLLISLSASAADPGHLRIQNNSPSYMTYTVPFHDNWWNCNDTPQRGFYVRVAPGATSPYFDFLRTEGHGCGGQQGQFAMVPSIPTYAAQPQQFTYDSHGGMAFAGPNPNYASQLSDDGNHNYTWIVTPTAK